MIRSQAVQPDNPMHYHSPETRLHVMSMDILAMDFISMSQNMSI